MEYCPGGEIYRLLRRKKHLTEPEASFYFSQLVEAFAYLHSKGVVYRDLKVQKPPKITPNIP